MLILKRALLGDKTAQASHFLVCVSEASGRGVDIPTTYVTSYVILIENLQCKTVYEVALVSQSGGSTNGHDIPRLVLGSNVMH